MQRLLISVRGPIEAMEAAKGGAHIADVEYPASALGTPYPLNIQAVRNRLNRGKFKRVLVSTNIGEKQHDRASACQAALGVATSGADIIKCGLADLPLKAAEYQCDTLVRTIKKYFPRKKVIPAVFIDKEMQRFFNPFMEGPKLAAHTKSDGILIDTFNKSIGQGLLDYCDLKSIRKFSDTCHDLNLEAWIAGSISADELSELWKTGVNVICIRGAACKQTHKGRFGQVKEAIVRDLAGTLRP